MEKVVDHDDDLDDVEANFVRRLKKGTDKYFGIFPFKCYNYGRIFHCASKCTFKEDINRRGDDRNKRGEDKRDKPKRIFYSKESTHSSKDEECDDSNDETVNLREFG